MRIELPFTQDDAVRAHAEWSCNCGPASLAAVLGRSLDAIRPAFDAVGFPAKRYTSPTMMKQAAHLAGAHISTMRSCSRDAITFAELQLPYRGLARLQWHGPWTAPGANPKWAYRHTHWIASWKTREGSSWSDRVQGSISPVIFDINGGVMSLERWEEEIVPAITSTIPRADGDWHVTHSWEIDRAT